MPPARFDRVPEQHQLLSCWLENCLRNHSKCRAAQHGFTPSRLLQLDCFPGSQDIRLVEFGSNARPRSAPVSYAALSHCWGMPGRLPIKTLKENLSKHLERIRFGDLSRTFQDAVQVARGLQLSYLWIDSLCIVQDDTEDWIREAEQMANVYRESVCTISALSADGGDSGCRVNACGEPVEQLRYVDLDIGEYRIRLVETEGNMEKQILTWDL